MSYTVLLTCTLVLVATDLAYTQPKPSSDEPEDIRIQKRMLATQEKVLGPEHREVAETLTILAWQYKKSGNLAEARQLLERALKIHDQQAAADPGSVVSTLNCLGSVLMETSDFAAAKPVLDRAIILCEKSFEPEAQETSVSLNNLGAFYYLSGDHVKAEPLLKRALRIRENLFGPEDPDVAETSAILARVYHSVGDYAKAEPLFARTLRIQEQVFGPEDPQTAGALNPLAWLYMDMGEYAKAEVLLQRALRNQEKAFGPEDFSVAETLNDLARLYTDMGEHTKSEPLAERALKISEKVVGPEHSATALALSNLGRVYRIRADYAGAESLFQRAFKITEKLLGPESATTAHSLNDLANLYREIGDYSKAKSLSQRACNIVEKVCGPEHPKTAVALNNLAMLHENMGEYSLAEQLFQRALMIMEKQSGTERPERFAVLNNLGNLYQTIGDYANAEPRLQRALVVSQQVFGPESRLTALSLHNLACVYEGMGSVSKAEPLLQRALTIWEKALGPDHPNTAGALVSLANVYKQMRDYAKAEPLLQRALTIWEKALGPDHPNTGGALVGLAGLYHRMGQYAQAEPLCLRALHILEKAGEPEHPNIIAALYGLSLLCADTGKRQKEMEFATRCERIRIKNLAALLSFTSERQRAAYQAQAEDPYSILVNLGAADEIAAALLRRKAVVLDSLLEDRLVVQASESPDDHAALNRLRTTRQLLAQLHFDPPNLLTPEAHRRRQAEKEKLAGEVEELEKALARRVAGLGRTRRALNVTVKQVQKSIPKQAVLVELLRYSHYLGRHEFEARYGAVVLAASGDRKWVPLGRAEAIEKQVAEFQATVRRSSASRTEPQLSPILAALYQQLWAPLEAALPKGTMTIIISPDAAVNFVPFAALLASDNKFLCEKYQIRYVTSGRDLLRPRVSPHTAKVVLFGNPDFSGKGLLVADTNRAESIVAMRDLERRDLAGIQLSSLPGTAQECAVLSARAEQWGWTSEVLTEAAANEEQLSKVQSPYILHIATHGFFLPDVEQPRADRFDSSRGIGGVALFGSSDLTSSVSQPSFGPWWPLKNPMHRSGLALAGAQTTFEAWKRGETPPANNDGIVTAEEVSLLKLEGTWLVVLSACDTGLGETKAGEGVLGLRRGFIQAGAENLVLTLWSVADQETAEFMLDFYQAAQGSGDAGGAFAQVQRAWLVRLREQRNLAAAVRLAGPFILTGN